MKSFHVEPDLSCEHVFFYALGFKKTDEQPPCHVYRVTVKIVSVYTSVGVCGRVVLRLATQTPHGTV